MRLAALIVGLALGARVGWFLILIADRTRFGTPRR